jgi:hypothetical protein
LKFKIQTKIHQDIDARSDSKPTTLSDILFDIMADVVTINVNNTVPYDVVRRAVAKASNVNQQTCMKDKRWNSKGEMQNLSLRRILLPMMIYDEISLSLDSLQQERCRPRGAVLDKQVRLRTTAFV